MKRRGWIRGLTAKLAVIFLASNSYAQAPSIPDTGIGAVLLMQYLPFYDDTAIDALQGFEERVYRQLQ